MKNKPWHYLNRENRLPHMIYSKRMDICNKCEFLFTPTKQCMKCGCFMEVKTKLKDAYCPIEKW